MLKLLRRAGAQLSGTFNQMNCAQAVELIPLHVAGDLTTKRAAAVARHLLACAGCRTQADEYAMSRAWLQTGAQAEFDDKFYDEIRAHVLRQIRQTQRPAPPQAVSFFALRFNRQLVYVAASIALLALVGALAWQIVSKHSDGKRTIIANANTAVEIVAPPPKVIETPTPVNSPAPEPTPPRAPVFKRHENQPPFVAVNRPQSPRVVKQLAPQPEQILAPPQHVALINGAPAGDATSASADVARIELQTADPNIRIIWLAPQPADVQPVKDK